MIRKHLGEQGDDADELWKKMIAAPRLLAAWM
jgi:hypothetical protein